MVELAPPSTSVPAFDVFLSHNSHDAAVAVEIATRLKRGGLEPWLDKWALTPGGDWQRELAVGLDASGACAVMVGPDDLGAWEHQEINVAVDRAAKDPHFRVIPVLLPGVHEPFDPNRLPHFLRMRTWVDFRRGARDSRALQDLINAVKGVPFGPAVPIEPRNDVIPYRGLRVFDEKHAEFFFGRDREIQRLLEKLKSSRLLAVLGSSGSGKSSLVRAGLIPALHRGALPEVTGWQVFVMRPGPAPLTALAAQIARLGAGDSMQATLDELGRDPRALHLAAELSLVRASPTDRVLLVVDQLEEAFTLCRDPAEREQFFSALLYATSAPGGRTVVVVTLRADFYAPLATHPEFAQAVTAQQMLVGKMDSDQLRQAIEEPARRVGLDLEEGLTETIMSDVGDEPGVLPLLEHLLLELWTRRRGDLLTLEGYREAGSVDGALAKRADEVYCALTTDQQDVARRTLLRLTQPGEGTEDTRRRATLAELAPPEPNGAFDVVLDRLVEARMLTRGTDETGTDIVDVSHEALIRGWPRLRGWIEADRAGLVLHRRLTDAAGEWNDRGRDPTVLWRGTRLLGACDWADDHPQEPSPLERAFLDASREAQRAELVAAKRRTRRLRILSACLAAGLLAAGVLAVLAVQSARQARMQRERAVSRSLAAQSAFELQTADDFDTAALLSVEAYRASKTIEARNALLSVVPGIGHRAGTLTGHSANVAAVAFSPDGSKLASVGGDGVRVWDVRSRKPLAAMSAKEVDNVAWSPDGVTVEAAGQDGTLRAWDVRTARPDPQPARTVLFRHDAHGVSLTGTTLVSWDGGTVQLRDATSFAPLGGPLRNGGDDVVAVAVTPNRAVAVLVSQDARSFANVIRIWDLRHHRPVGRLLGDPGVVTDVAVDPAGTLVAVAADRRVRVWSLATRRPRAGSAPTFEDIVQSVAFSPDGETLVAGDDGGAVRLWNVQTGRAEAVGGHSERVSDVAFSPDGKTVSSSSEDDTVRLWRTAVSPLARPLRGMEESVDSLAFRADGAIVAGSRQNDPNVHLLDVRTGRTEVVPGTGRGIAQVAFSPRGAVLASLDRDGTVRLWDTVGDRPIGDPFGRGTGVTHLTFSTDGRVLLTAGSQEIAVWSVRTGRPVAPPIPAEANALSVAGDLLAYASPDDIRFVDLTTGHRVGAALSGADVTSLAFTSDGRTLVSGDGDNKVKLWDVRDRSQIGAALVGTRPIDSVAISPDDRTIASAGDDGVVRLWDLQSRRALGAPLAGRKDARFTTLAFSPDGRQLAGGGFSNVTRLWDSILWSDSGAALRRRICASGRLAFTRGEWKDVVSDEPYHRTCGSS